MRNTCSHKLLFCLVVISSWSHLVLAQLPVPEGSVPPQQELLAVKEQQGEIATTQQAPELTSAPVDGSPDGGGTTPDSTPVPSDAPQPTLEPTTTAPPPDVTTEPPVESPTPVPTEQPSAEPTQEPTLEPTPLPTAALPPPVVTVLPPPPPLSLPPPPPMTFTPPPAASPSPAPVAPPPPPPPAAYLPLETALLDFKSGIGNGQQVSELSSWVAGTDPCKTWTGVECNSDGNIVSLVLSNTNPKMEGGIPNALTSEALSKSIENIDLSDNLLTGSIPIGFANPQNFQKLKKLMLHRNQLTGGLLDMPKGVQQLQTLELHNNRIQSFPFQGNFKNLKTLSVYNNLLNDPIPSTFYEVVSGPNGAVIIQPQSNGYSVCGALPPSNPSSPQWLQIDIENSECEDNIDNRGSDGCFTVLTFLPSCSGQNPSPEPVVPGDAPSSDSSGLPTWAIILIGVIGGVALLSLILTIWILTRKKNKYKNSSLSKNQDDKNNMMERGYSVSSKTNVGDSGSLESGRSSMPTSPHGENSFDPLMDWANGSKFSDSNGAGGLNPGAMAAAAAVAGGVAAASGISRESSEGKHTRGSSKGNIQLDVKLWTLDFKDLKIEKQIGEGSFGRVYQAKWNETPVAVKILIGMDPTEEDEHALTLSSPVLDALAKESTMMAALRHPNVVSFLGVCLQPPSIVTEYCARRSLTDVLRGAKSSPAKAGEMAWVRRLNMVLDAAKGMLYLHAHSPPIIHRDLKSPNLLVDGHWRVKVSDFNLSKLLEEGTAMSSMAATNPRWLAPEILAGNAATFASDVYSFAVVLWEVLTWELPWGPTNPWQVRLEDATQWSL